jgi:serine/threonine-protein kinase
MADERIGKYRLQKMIASGGMGEIFLARQEGPQGFAKPVVIKRILKHYARDETFVEMFVNEARLAALLNHPNIVQIFELGKAQGTYFIAMEFIHGRTLRAVKAKLKQRARGFPAGYAARIASAALHGLHYAHTLKGQQGEALKIIHRDMSPDNVMVGFDGGVKILDFGIAKTALATSTTEVGTVKGKYAYMSPEQLDAKPLDGRTDVWSVGVMLYELLAGQRPFTAEEDAALVKQILNTEPLPLSERNPEVPKELGAIVSRALNKDRNQRYSSAEAMAVALEGFVTSAQVSLSDAETAAFMKELYGDDESSNPAALTPSGEQQVPFSGLYLSSASNEMTQSTQMSVILTYARARWRALLVGLLAAAAMCGGGVALAVMGAKKPMVVAPPVDPIAALPEVEEVDAGPDEADPAAANDDPGKAPDPASPDTPNPSPPPPPHPTAGVALGKGKVDLRVKPWAEVFEGKKSFGVTPMPPFELAAGKHVLTLKNSDLSVEKHLPVKVPRDGVVTVRVDLRR